MIVLRSSAVVNAMERAELKISIISDQLGLSWAGECWAAADAFSTLCAGLFPVLC